MTRDLVTDVHENLQGAFSTLADELQTGEVRQFGPLTVACAGVPVPLFNRAFVFEAPPVEDLSAAVAWLSDRKVPFFVTVADPVLEDVANHLADLGLVKAGEQPGMAMASLEEIPSRDSVAEIAEVTDPDELQEFSRVAASVFETPLDVERRLDRVALATDEMHPFLGRVEGTAASSGLLARTGDVAGVYVVGVTEQFRRRGIGEATSWAVLRAGREAGCRVGVLQSSEMGYPLYERMGFETVVTYHQFEPAD